jgi:hypothetical protein
MSEQDPLQQRIEQALKTTVEQAAEDGLYRDGQLFRFPSQMGTSLEVFPSHGLVRVTTPDRSQLELHDQGQPRIEDNTVVFEGRHQRLTLHADGKVLWQHVPAAPEAPAGRPEGAGSTSDLPQHASGPQEASETVVRDQLAVTKTEENGQRPQKSSEEAEEERVELTGRLGRTPTFRTTPKGVFIAKFPLAVHLEDGATKWHTILAFGPRAQKLEEKVTEGAVAKGREVDVIGYVHTREEQGKNGKTRTLNEVYAAVVRCR